MPGASEQTRRVKHLNVNWSAGPDERFYVQIITEDGQRHVVPASPASMTALATLAQSDTVMAWDPDDNTLIVANVVGQMSWTVRREDS